MISQANTIEEYIESLPSERKKAIIELHQTILSNLPNGFKSGMQYGMIGYYVPHNLYPAGYHCDKNQPLPFASIASQKNSINIYHMGIYMKPELMQWYLSEYPKYIKTKPDMGKSCLRFKKTENLPLKLISELMRQISVDDYIKLYEETYKNSTR